MRNASRDGGELVLVLVFVWFPGKEPEKKT